MGKYRKEYSVRQKEKIHRPIMDDFGVTEKDLYQVWLMFMFYTAKKIGRVKIMEKLRNNPGVNKKALEYFCWQGLNNMTNKMVDILDN